MVANALPYDTGALDAHQVRQDFPTLHQRVNGHPLVYLDNAATTQKPTPVIDAISGYLEWDNSNVHRGVHTLSARATTQFDASRRTVQRFLNAPSANEIVFTRGTTEAINLVAQSFLRPRLAPGDEILVTTMEHHSNIVPWQLLGEHTGAVLKVAPIDDAGQVIVEEYERLLGPRTRLVALAHASNALGTVNPIELMIALAHVKGIPVLIDGAQAVAHLPVDVQALGCDFYAFSGHKLYGPTGIGALYGRAELLEGMPPYQGGGDMIVSVSFEETTFAPPPNRFEAGTPNISGAIGLGAAIDYFEDLGRERAWQHERELLAYATDALSSIDGVQIVGTAAHKIGVLSFLVNGVHPHDIGTILDGSGVAIRAGHHCAQPVMQRYGIAATARASLGVYNTHDDIDRLVAAVGDVKELFS